MTTPATPAPPAPAPAPAPPPAPAAPAPAPPSPAPAPTPAPGTGGDVPWHRFQTATEQKNAALARVAELEGEVQKYMGRAATADTLASQLKAAQAETATAQNKFTVHTELSGALGVTDPDVIGLFDGQYARLPAKDRPSRADWVKGLREAVGDKDKAATVPAVMRPFLANTAANGGGGGTPPPKNPGGGGGGDGAGSIEKGQITAAWQHYQTTGDRSRYDALRAKTPWAGHFKSG